LERQNYRSSLKPISVTPAPRSATSRSRSSQLLSHPLTAPLPLTVFLTLSAPVPLQCFKQQTEQEGQHPLTGQRAANFRLLANQ